MTQQTLLKILKTYLDLTTLLWSAHNTDLQYVRQQIEEKTKELQDLIELAELEISWQGFE